MPSHKMGRVTEDIRRELSAIFRELKDPRVQGLISIVRVEVTNDLSYCTVYVSAMGGLEQAKTAVAGLKSAGGKPISRRLSARPGSSATSSGRGCGCAMCRKCCSARPIPSNTAPIFPG